MIFWLRQKKTFGIDHSKNYQKIYICDMGDVDERVCVFMYPFIISMWLIEIRIWKNENNGHEFSNLDPFLLFLLPFLSLSLSRKKSYSVTNKNINVRGFIWHSKVNGRMERERGQLISYKKGCGFTKRLLNDFHFKLTHILHLRTHI